MIGYVGKIKDSKTIAIGYQCSIESFGEGFLLRSDAKALPIDSPFKILPSSELVCIVVFTFLPTVTSWDKSTFIFKKPTLIIPIPIHIVPTYSRFNKIAYSL